MAHFTRVRTDLAAWSTSNPVDPDEFEKFDANLFAAINGDAGGTWAPSSLIQIGGSGISVSGPATFSSFIYATGSLLVSGTLGTTGAGQITGTWPGSPTFSGNPTFSGTVTHSGTLTSSGGTLSGSWAGAPTFSGNPVFSGTPSFTAMTGNTAIGGNPTFSGSVTLTGTLTASGTGHIRNRVVAGYDGNQTYSASDADTISIGNITGSHVYTISNGTTGDKLKIFKRAQAAANTVTISGTLHLGTGNTIMKNQTAGDMYCVELEWDGSGWLMTEFYR